eukprot:CAMPEP_0195028320 /NCGR_PEP_ID=MMETSP0326_2-20130528/54198_1 /TAXON_ID=2866 ORGANISM="Crypthecodinium cohnii, Strain Seligo" /NCGR_SAMPLE_ID=MMETSP0326_2 /ASSEMBLY_ACC=CAM_ASM_000348 /LENGTH=56 /DNA_ID=CAMNT_0040050803 /DNA_START=217 /DNA_END=387 /DNA_ORIENTATION=+
MSYDFSTVSDREQQQQQFLLRVCDRQVKTTDGNIGQKIRVEDVGKMGGREEKWTGD